MENTASIEVRQIKRSLNRNKARQQQKNQSNIPPLSAPTGAQEPEDSLTKKDNIRNYRHIRYGQCLEVGTLNSQGMKAAAKREMIEQYMKLQTKTILATQETHMMTTHVEKRKQFTCLFSGQTEKGEEARRFAGVAIIIDNECINYIKTIEPINDRRMTIEIRHTVTICIINVYAPTAEQITEDRHKFYALTAKQYKENKGKGPTIVTRDLNAIIQIKAAAAETCIGKHTF